MNAPVRHAPGRERTVVIALRDAARTAPARCECYAAFSELTASPHELQLKDAVGKRIGAAACLPYGAHLRDLIHEFVASDVAELRSGYSGLFEVGSQGPPAPIREDLQTGQRAGTREDIVRFYDYFGYRLDERFAWAPDHLSVELEFMHFLCFNEASDASDPLSWQLAQADFAGRHLHNWTEQLAATVAQLASGSFYSRVLAALQDFVARDLEWQVSTIATGAAAEAASSG